MVRISQKVNKKNYVTFHGNEIDCLLTSGRDTRKHFIKFVYLLFELMRSAHSSISLATRILHTVL